MVASLIAFALLAAFCGFLWQKVTRLQRQLREAQSESAADASLENEKLAILREANEVLRVKNRRVQDVLVQAQQELNSLTYSISHDLRAPLRSIDGFSQALAEDYGPRLDGTAHDYLRRLRLGALHLNTLVDQLLGLSRLVRAPFHPETLDLSALVWDIAHTLAAAEPGRRVEWSIQPGLTAWGDRALLMTALTHLLRNAWKFTGGLPVGHVAFRAVTGATEPAFEVRDDGAGFDMAYAGRLFGAFQRMHAADEFAGHGVGLAATQRIVRRHGGDIRASAEPGQGAVFTFTLEARPEHDPAEGLLPPMAPQSAAGIDARLLAQPKPTAV